MAWTPLIADGSIGEDALAVVFYLLLVVSYGLWATKQLSKPTTSEEATVTPVTSSTPVAAAESNPHRQQHPSSRFPGVNIFNSRPTAVPVRSRDRFEISPRPDPTKAEVEAILDSWTRQKAMKQALRKKKEEDAAKLYAEYVFNLEQAEKRFQRPPPPTSLVGPTRLYIWEPAPQAPQAPTAPTVPLATFAPPPPQAPPAYSAPPVPLAPLAPPAPPARPDPAPPLPPSLPLAAPAPPARPAQPIRSAPPPPAATSPAPSAPLVRSTPPVRSILLPRAPSARSRPAPPPPPAPPAPPVTTPSTNASASSSPGSNPLDDRSIVRAQQEIKDWMKDVDAQTTNLRRRGDESWNTAATNQAGIYTNITTTLKHIVDWAKVDGSRDWDHTKISPQLASEVGLRGAKIRLLLKDLKRTQYMTEDPNVLLAHDAVESAALFFE